MAGGLTELCNSALETPVHAVSLYWSKTGPGRRRKSSLTGASPFSFMATARANGFANIFLLNFSTLKFAPIHFRLLLCIQTSWWWMYKLITHIERVKEFFRSLIHLFEHGWRKKKRNFVSLSCSYFCLKISKPDLIGYMEMTRPLYT